MRNPTPLALAALLASAAVSAQGVTVPPGLETQAGPSTSGGNVRDVALWVNPADGGASLLLTAYDNFNAGLTTFGVDGRQLEAEQDGPALSVAVRDEFPLAGGSRTLVVTANSSLGLAAYRVDPGGADRVLRIGPAGFLTGTAYASVALYRSPGSGRFYLFAGTQGGLLQQFELTGADGGVTAAPVRTLNVGTGVAGLVADEDTGLLFVVEAGRALWRYAAEPDGGTDRQQVAALGGQLSTGVNRLGLYRAANGEGYLIAADTAADAFAVFERRSQVFVGSFRVVADGGIGEVEDPVALAVSSRPVGPAFPDGLFVAHDGIENPQNLKLVSWAAVASAFDPPLRIDTRQGTDGGADAGGEDAGDAGPSGPGNPPGPGIGVPSEDDGGGCSCSTASVPAVALLGLLALALAGRRRRR